ncbi:MAG: hypothetical protein PHC61_17000 [Chitinivibrionales bacterium]|nr:hypothetical protein [Chitinivibrionales bacterium]
MGRRYCIAILLFLNAVSAQADVSQKLRKYFEWGEYDSLATAAQKGLGIPGKVADSQFTADCHKYLGVVAMSRGNITDARSEFERAYTLDKKITLDSLYISRPIYEMFISTIQDYREALHSKTENDSILKAKETAVRMNEELKASLKHEKKDRITTIVSIASFGLMAICGATAIYEYVQGNKSYQDFKNAATEGDYLRYTQDKKAVRQSDILAIAFGCGALAVGSPGLYFSLKPAVVPRHSNQPKQKASADISLSLCYEFSHKN